MAAYLANGVAAIGGGLYVNEINRLKRVAIQWR